MVVNLGVLDATVSIQLGWEMQRKKKTPDFLLVPCNVGFPFMEAEKFDASWEQVEDEGISMLGSIIQVFLVGNLNS